MKNKPAFIIDVCVPPGSFDVNLTPDKREIVLVHNYDITYTNTIIRLIYTYNYVIVFQI